MANLDMIMTAFWFGSVYFNHVFAGTCWMEVGSNDRCKGYERTDVSFEECCSSGSGNVHAGWTSGDNPSNGQLFFWHALAGGAPQCRSCAVSCDNIRCGPEKQCRMRHGRPRCVCDPDCSSHRARRHGYVCGTDRRTYKNHCSVLKHNCRQNDHVDVEFYGRCQPSCATVRCEEGKHCVEDQHGLPHCVNCQTSCPPVYDNSQQVCGADGITYDSICEIQRAACVGGSSIILAYSGPCDDSATCATLRCPRSKICLVDPNNGRPQCTTCDGYCRDVEGSPPICANNGETYYSYCQMRREACASGVSIETVHSGPCAE